MKLLSERRVTGNKEERNGDKQRKSEGKLRQKRLSRCQRIRKRVT